MASKFPISKKLIDELKTCCVENPTKLIEQCGAFNVVYAKGYYSICAVIIRAMLDYIPPVFGFDNRAMLIAHIKDKKTFKSAVNCLDQAFRNLADDFLHAPATRKEFLKIRKSVVDTQIPNLTLVLGEVVKQLREEDRRCFEGGKKKHEGLNSPNQNHLKLFERYVLHTDKWRKEFIDAENIWIYECDNTFQIHERCDSEEFSEPWSQVYPDKNGSHRYSVDLIYNGNHIKRFFFVSCDGGRINVAMPKRREDKRNFWENKDIYGASYKNVGFYWDVNSLEFNLTKLIGDFYIYRSIEEVARISKIDIVGLE